MAPPQLAATVRVHDQTNRRDVEPDADGNYQLRCWHEYRLHCSEDPCLPGSAGSCFQPSDGSEWIAEANFGDFVGTLALLGRAFTVTSRKLDEAGFSRLLDDVARRAATLPFTSGAPALLPFERASLSEPRVLYDAFVFLRWALREARPTLCESVETIAHDPHRAVPAGHVGRRHHGARPGAAQHRRAVRAHHEGHPREPLRALLARCGA